MSSTQAIARPFLRFSTQCWIGKVLGLRHLDLSFQNEGPLVPCFDVSTIKANSSQRQGGYQGYSGQEL